MENKDAIAEVRIEPDYWSRGHFYQGTRKVLRVLQDIQNLPVGTGVYLGSGAKTGTTQPLILGMKGSAFDLPTQRRAYTYAEQPGNVAAWRIGEALAQASRGGDPIDAGLSLLRMLQERGFGVFELGDVAHGIKPPAPREPLTDEALKRMHHEDQFGLFCDYDEFEQIARAIEAAHSIQPANKEQPNG